MLPKQKSAMLNKTEKVKRTKEKRGSPRTSMRKTKRSRKESTKSKQWTYASDHKED